MMKKGKRHLKWFCIFLVAALSFGSDVRAESLFKNRRIELGREESRVFSIGVTGTTAGYNYIALVENAREEAISLGDLGYWELVSDPPSFLRNYDIQITVKNQAQSKFKIEFEYDRRLHDITYKVAEGAVTVKLDTTGYYPALIIENADLISKGTDEIILPKGAKRVLFFDFNSFDADLRSYYGSVKRLTGNPDYKHYFYYYEAGNYNSYYFKTLDTVAKLDTEKMGLSLENGTLKYYQTVLDNIKSRHGADFADQVILVTRFGKKFSEELKKYADEIGMKKNLVITVRSYDDIK